MTVPVQEDQDPPKPSFRFPLNWLLTHASPIIQARAKAEVAGLTEGALQDSAPPTSAVALELTMTQSVDGVWSNAILGIPDHPKKGTAGVGTVPAVLRLAESGWIDKDLPVMIHARKILFRMLAEDNDPAYLFEYRAKAKDEEMVRAYRRLLREASACALARAGYQDDPRVRGAARRIVQRISTFLASPIAKKPWMRIGNVHVLMPDAAPPSIYALEMLSYMPSFRHEYYAEMRLLYEHLNQTLPRQEVVQLVGKEIVPKPSLVMGDMLSNRNVVDADVPFALFWLELMARLDFLKENEHWLKMFERLEQDRGKDGVWHPHKGHATPTSDNPYTWHVFPLQEDMHGPGAWADVTFRLGLIAKLLDYKIELI